MRMKRGEIVMAMILMQDESTIILNCYSNLFMNTVGKIEKAEGVGVLIYINHVWILNTTPRIYVAVNVNDAIEQ